MPVAAAAGRRWTRDWPFSFSDIDELRDGMDGAVIDYYSSGSGWSCNCNRRHDWFRRRRTHDSLLTTATWSRSGWPGGGLCRPTTSLGIDWAVELARGWHVLAEVKLPPAGMRRRNLDEVVVRRAAHRRVHAREQRRGGREEAQRTAQGERKRLGKAQHGNRRGGAVWLTSQASARGIFFFGTLVS